jgi:hypothetical protein
MLIPKDEDPWKSFVDRLDMFTGDFFNFGREQRTLEKRDAIE